MAHIKITKGLDIPIVGKPSGKIKPFQLSGDASPQKTPPFVSLNLDPFDQVRFKLLAKKGDVVRIGEPLVEDKGCPGRVWVSPAGGVVDEVRRGLKRRLLDIVIQVSNDEEYQDHGTHNVRDLTPQELIHKLKAGGLFAHIRRRPFNILANPDERPRSIFVKAVESAPFVPPAEMQVEGHEEDFQTGLDVLSKLTEGNVHLIISMNSTLRAFTEAKNVKRHTTEGPHSISSPSLHIHHLDPIKTADTIIWTLNAHDVVAIGHLFRNGHYFIERVIGIGGPGIIPERVGYFKVRAGQPIDSLISNRITKGFQRLISGDPLTGQKVEQDDFLGFSHFAFCAIPESTTREFLHFFRLGINKYSFSGTYVSGHLNNEFREYDFTTSLHGEHRAFIDPTLYDKVMPLAIPTMHLVKAVMAEDYDLAEELGLLEVDSEDFTLPTFVCPSKIDMTEIIKRGIRAYSEETLG